MLSFADVQMMLREGLADQTVGMLFRNGRIKSVVRRGRNAYRIQIALVDAVAYVVVEV